MALFSSEAGVGSWPGHPMKNTLFSLAVKQKSSPLMVVVLDWECERWFDWICRALVEGCLLIATLGRSWRHGAGLFGSWSSGVKLSSAVTRHCLSLVQRLATGRQQTNFTQAAAMMQRMASVSPGQEDHAVGGMRLLCREVAQSTVPFSKL